jgi:hypothetical protein
MSRFGSPIARTTAPERGLPTHPLAGPVVVSPQQLLASHQDGLDPDGSGDRVHERRRPRCRAPGPPDRALSPTERPWSRRHGLDGLGGRRLRAGPHCSSAKTSYGCRDKRCRSAAECRPAPVSGGCGKCGSRTTSANNHRTVAARNAGRNCFDYGVGGAVHLIPEGGPRRPERGPDVSWAGVLRGLTGFVQR